MELPSPSWIFPETGSRLHPPSLLQRRVVDLGELVEDEPDEQPGGDDADPETSANLDCALLPLPPKVSVDHRVPGFNFFLHRFGFPHLLEHQRNVSSLFP